MANKLREYTSPVDKLSPNEVGINATVRVGTHLAEIGQRAGNSIARAGADLGQGGAELQKSGGQIERTGGQMERTGSEMGKTASQMEKTGSEFGRAGSQMEKTGSEYARTGAEFDQVARGRAQAFEALGHSVNDAGKVVAEMYDRLVVQPDVHKVTAAGAITADELSQGWNETAKASAPYDTTTAQKWRDEKLEPALTKLVENADTHDGKEHAMKFGERLRQHMYEKTTADMATKAGDAAVTTADTVKTRYSRMVANDPSSLEFAHEQMEADVRKLVQSTPNLTATAAAKVESTMLGHYHKNLDQAALMSMADKDAPAAEKALTAGRFKYIDGIEEMRAIKVMDRMQKAEVRAERAEKRSQLTEGANEFANKATLSLIGADGKLSVPPGYFDNLKKNFGPLSAANPTLLRALMTQAERLMDRNAKETVLTNPDVEKKLADGLFAADVNQQTRLEDIIKAHNDKQISDHSFANLRRNWDDLRTAPQKGPGFQSAMKAAEAAITYQGPVGSFFKGKDPVGLANYSAFVQNFLPAYNAAARAGKLEPNALDLKDETSMISKMMKPYTRSTADVLSDRVKAATDATTAERKDAAPTFTPPPTWQYSPSQKRYRDPEGNHYDEKGQKVK